MTLFFFLFSIEKRKESTYSQLIWITSS